SIDCQVVAGGRSAYCEAIGAQLGDGDGASFDRSATGRAYAAVSVYLRRSGSGDSNILCGYGDIAAAGIAAAEYLGETINRARRATTKGERAEERLHNYSAGA